MTSSGVVSVHLQGAPSGFSAQRSVHLILPNMSGKEVDPKAFYVEKDPEVNLEAKAMFTQRGGIAEDEIVLHIRAIVSEGTA